VAYAWGMRSRGLVVIVSMVVLVAGCTTAGTDTTTTTVASTTSSSTTTSSTTTTSSPTTTTTTAPSTTTTSATTVEFHPVPPIPLAPPDPLPGSDGASGSGCAPGSDDLPDGVWFVFLIENLPGSVRGDLACFWFGDIAYEVGEAAGVEVENDFYISNESDRIRTTPVAPDAVVWTLAGDTTEGHSSVPYADWPIGESTYVPCPGDFCTVWLYINDGVVTDIVEQYIP